MHLKHKGTVHIAPRTAKCVPNTLPQSWQGTRLPPRMSTRANLVIRIPLVWFDSWLLQSNHRWFVRTLDRFESHIRAKLTLGVERRVPSVFEDELLQLNLCHASSFLARSEPTWRNSASIQLFWRFQGSEKSSFGLSSI